jgi:hypothetical protein
LSSVILPAVVYATWAHDKWALFPSAVARFSRHMQRTNTVYGSNCCQQRDSDEARKQKDHLFFRTRHMGRDSWFHSENLFFSSMAAAVPLHVYICICRFSVSPLLVQPNKKRENIDVEQCLLKPDCLYTTTSQRWSDGATNTRTVDFRVSPVSSSSVGIYRNFYSPLERLFSCCRCCTV